jgi:hypothetical protein
MTTRQQKKQAWLVGDYSGILSAQFRQEEMHQGSEPASMIRTAHHMEVSRDTMKRKSIYERMGLGRFK